MTIDFRQELRESVQTANVELTETEVETLVLVLHVQFDKALNNSIFNKISRIIHGEIFGEIGKLNKYSKL